jgi:hypothetical protein
MRPVRLICASSDLARARTIEHLLAMEGFEVKITTRRLSGAPETDDEAPAPECGVVLWSQNSVDSWPVLELAEEMHAQRSLVQVALEPVAPGIASYSGPIDFKAWCGERDSAWSMLRTRMELIEQGGEPTGAPLGAVAALGLASLSILSIAVSDRVGEGSPTGPPLHTATRQPFEAILAPEPVESAMGGPIALEAGPDFSIAVPETTTPLRTQLPPLPDLETPHATPRLRVARPGLLRSILRGVEQLASFGDDDESGKKKS